MIRTLRGLAIAGAVAIVLAIAVIALRPRQAGVVERSLVPGFDVARVTRLEIRRTDEPGVSLERVDPIWRANFGTPDPTTVDALVSALRGARWHRRVPATTVGRGEAGAARAARSSGHELRIIERDGIAELELGPELPGADQSWIIRGSDALLVDSWVVKALFPTRLDLTVRHPFADAAQADSITDGTVELVDGAHLTKPVSVWVDPARTGELTTRLATLEVVGYVDPHPGPRGRHVATSAFASHVDATEIGTCQTDRVLLEISTGDGCVRRDDWQRVLAAFDALAKLPPAELADRRVAPVTPQKLDFGDGTVIDLARPGDLDADRLAALVDALASTAEVVDKLPAGEPRRTLMVDGGRDTVKLAIHATAIVRDDERFALVPLPAAMTRLLAPPSALRDPVLWREEVTTLSSIDVDGVVYKRGVVLGEWSGAADPALVDALASTLATVRAPAGRPPARVVHTIRVTFTPPAGEPSSHVLALGAPAAGGCPAMVDGAAVTLDLALCTAGTAVAEQQRR
jgi:hypothetical protein